MRDEARKVAEAHKKGQCKARVWDNGDMTDCGKPLPCPDHGDSDRNEGRFFCDTSGF